MTEECPHINVPCPYCHTGIIDSRTGTAQHTVTQMVWVNVACAHCHRTFTYTATRPLIPPAPLIGESTVGT